MSRRAAGTPQARPLVLAVGHFPPPVHGMAVATQRMVTLISERAGVRRLVISVEERHGVVRHLQRAARTIRALFRIAIDRRAATALYVGSDAGLGMTYTLAVVVLGRILGHRTFLHHHSAAYVNEHSALMSAIVRSGGDSCTHVLGCEGQARAFDSRYRPRVASTVVSIAFALGESHHSDEEASGSGRSRPEGGLTLGHLSNLSVEKGLERVFQTLHSSIAACLDAHLVVAGPPASPEDEAVLKALLARAHPHADYLGPADERAKRAFLDRIDVFLFPSRYRHESFGLVVGEAMGAGVPVITHRAGCLDAAFVGGGGLVLEPGEEFVSSAVRQLCRWSAVPEELESCSAEARSRARAARAQASEDAVAFVELLTMTRPG